MTMNKHDEAVECANISLRMYRAVYGEDANHVDIVDLLARLVLTYTKMRQYETSENYHSEALKTYRAVYGVTAYAQLLKNFGNNQYLMGYHNKAGEYYKQSIDMFYKIYGKETSHADIANLLNNLGNIQVALGRLNTSSDLYHESLTM